MAHGAWRMVLGGEAAHLRKQRLAHVHVALPVVEFRKHRK